MAVSSLSLSFFLLLVHILPSAYAIGGFRVELIHRDSPKSPFYNPSATRFHRVAAAAHRSVFRAKHIGLALSPSLSSDEPIQSKLIPDFGSYLMAFKLGSPAFDIVAIADTGSDLTWTNCKPCTNCYDQAAPMFDPAASSTYREVACGTEPCQALPSQACSEDFKCEYHYAYGDRSNVDGILSTETFTFDTTGGSSAALPKMLFGCSHQSIGTFNNMTAGLVGLGGGPLSLISQLGSSIDRKFSYCLVPIGETEQSNWLNFGAGVVLPPAANILTTPLIKDPLRNTFYFLNLQSIAVSGQNIQVPQSSSEGQGNIIIDSGTTLTILDPDVINKIVEAISQVITLDPVNDPNYNAFAACYKTGGSEDTGYQFPKFTFNFDGAAVELSPLNTFVEVAEGVTCLALTSSSDIQIYGNLAQQNYFVDYDLGKGTLSFAQTNCGSAN